MKSKLVTIGIVSLTAGLMAFVSSAFAQARAEGSNKTISLYAPSTDASKTTVSGNSAPAVAATDSQMSYRRMVGPANTQSAVSSQQIAAETPEHWLESKARRDKDSLRSRGIPETLPCLGGGHYYALSVVNSVPSSCFLGNSGPGAFGIGF
jgi:hypothetical protein